MIFILQIHATVNVTETQVDFLRHLIQSRASSNVAVEIITMATLARAVFPSILTAPKELILTPTRNAVSKYLYIYYFIICYLNLLISMMFLFTYIYKVFNRMFFNKGATRKMNRVLSISTVVHNDNIHHFIIKASLLFVGNVCVCNNRPHFLERP